MVFVEGNIVLKDAQEEEIKNRLKKTMRVLLGQRECANLVFRRWKGSVLLNNLLGLF